MSYDLLAKPINQVGEEGGGTAILIYYEKPWYHQHRLQWDSNLQPLSL